MILSGFSTSCGLITIIGGTRASTQAYCATSLEQITAPGFMECLQVQIDLDEEGCNKPQLPEKKTPMGIIFRVAELMSVTDWWLHRRSATLLLRGLQHNTQHAVVAPSLIDFPN